MGMWIGRNRKARVTYGFDEIALVPGRVTINPNEVDITFRLPRKAAEPLELKIPIRASAMDGVVDVGFAIAMKFCKKSSKLVNRRLLRCCSEFTRNRFSRTSLRLVCAKSRTPVL